MHGLGMRINISAQPALQPPGEQPRNQLARERDRIATLPIHRGQHNIGAGRTMPECRDQFRQFFAADARLIGECDQDQIKVSA